MNSPAFHRVELMGRQISWVPPGDLGAVVARLSGNDCRVAYFCNVHMLMLSREDHELARAMDSADCVFADGVPVAWLQRQLSGCKNRVVRGYEVMLAVCERAAREGRRIGLFGSTPPVLDGLARSLEERFPGLQIGLRFSPPQVDRRVTSTDAELQRIRDANVDWLFVGLGCPKQEKWIADHKDRLECGLLGVGAAFDWLAGTAPMPPAWMQRSGLGWLFRLLNNPRKMWRRYLIYNVKFMLSVSTLLLQRGFGKRNA